MGKDKLLIVYQRKTLLRLAIELLYELPVSEKLIVTTEAKLKQVEIPSGIQVAINENPNEGQSGSVRLGVKMASGTHFLFLTADQPRLTLSSLMPLITLAEKNQDRIIFPVVNNNPTSPVLFPASYRKEFLGLVGDTGGRLIREAYPEKCLPFEPELPELFFDVDDAEDLTMLRTEGREF